MENAHQKDIEEAIAASLTWKQFLRVLEKQGYPSGSIEVPYADSSEYRAYCSV
ncbi:MAG: hypothetical protein ACLR5S_11145 [Ruminococcus sp.]